MEWFLLFAYLVFGILLGATLERVSGLKEDQWKGFKLGIAVLVWPLISLFFTVVLSIEGLGWCSIQLEKLIKRVKT